MPDPRLLLPSLSLTSLLPPSLFWSSLTSSSSAPSPILGPGGPGYVESDVSGLEELLSEKKGRDKRDGKERYSHINGDEEIDEEEERGEEDGSMREKGESTEEEEEGLGEGREGEGGESSEDDDIPYKDEDDSSTSSTSLSSALVDESASKPRPRLRGEGWQSKKDTKEGKGSIFNQKQPTVTRGKRKGRLEKESTTNTDKKKVTSSPNNEVNKGDDEDDVDSMFSAELTPPVSKLRKSPTRKRKVDEDFDDDDDDDDEETDDEIDGTSLTNYKNSNNKRTIPTSNSRVDSNVRGNRLNTLSTSSLQHAERANKKRRKSRGNKGGTKHSRMRFGPLAVLTYTRSSGPGGQNANKLNTACVLRISSTSIADYLGDPDVGRRLKDRWKGVVCGKGDIVIKGGVHRTQAANKKDVIGRLNVIVSDVMVPDKVRQMRDADEISNVGKMRRRKEKSKRKGRKGNRGNVKFD